MGDPGVHPDREPGTPFPGAAEQFPRGPRGHLDLPASQRFVINLLEAFAVLMMLPALIGAAVVVLGGITFLLETHFGGETTDVLLGLAIAYGLSVGVFLFSRIFHYMALALRGAHVALTPGLVFRRLAHRWISELFQVGAVTLLILGAMGMPLTLLRASQGELIPAALIVVGGVGALVAGTRLARWADHRAKRLAVAVIEES